MNKVVILSAPSGAGKTTIVHALLQAGLPLGFSISATSRPAREHETNGVDYYFFTVEDFKEKIAHHEFIEWEEVYDGLFYGTLKTELERVWKSGQAIVFDVDVKGGVNLKKHFSETALSIFIQPPSVKELEKRLRNRKTETEESIKKRIDRARYELGFASQFDVVVVNDNLEEAVNKANNLVKDFLAK
ncbi:MAG: guanylate kinase [Bacteroidetes bacterium HGW-Bacteroidetes-6]|jgi:guanylate kinase|nr:MAG: guanylate kinase [Bacteroidetes bacterium HGW-Bacteroidetes-6]